ncbi:MAG TPA: cell division protein FtsQ/DivIB [Bacteriovoracaceae bacterium]|nr:cell division protein FtsQ/DivIB [Bacteriovoracaceae bacterium]
MGKTILASITILFITTASWASLPDSFTQNNVRYQTFFGECPSKSSGMFALLVMKEFEKDHSLKLVKEKIVSERWDEKYFLSDYRISYNPVSKSLKISLECPNALAKVQVYKSTGEEHYSAILGDNNKLYEPHYENLLRVENKLNHHLPRLALSADQLTDGPSQDLTRFINKVSPDLRQKISEIIISKNNELTIVFSLAGKATSVFMGADLWDEKITKLGKIVGYVTKNKKYPKSINLVNAKKVVVKF